MKKVIFGSALLIGGILLTTLSAIAIKGSSDGGLLEVFTWVGVILFVVGIAFGIKGLSEKE